MRQELVDELVTAAQNVVNDAERPLNDRTNYVTNVYEVDFEILDSLKAIVQKISDDAIEQIRAIQQEYAAAQAALAVRK